jgi:hypothetical protein
VREASDGTYLSTLGVGAEGDGLIAWDEAGLPDEREHEPATT